jgi:tyrosyl-tRNA synthetase
MEPLSEILKSRGLAYQHSSATLEELTDGAKRTVYLGIDPSADSLHIGNLQAMLVLRRFLEAGHKVILLIGGGTGMIGDPSGKSEERNLLDTETLARNTAALGEQAKKLFGGLDFKLVNNADWLGQLDMISFLRDVGKHFSVNAMLARDSVKNRLDNEEQGISYTEFSYMLLQSYDFYHLFTEFGCDVQIGSSDQWGNIVSGVDFIRRKTGKTAYAFTSPLLINKATGKKFGKSEGGAVWLDAAKTSPYAFYQFWLNTDDADVNEFMQKMTMMPLAKIAEAMEEHTKNPGKRIAQKLLAREVTALVHGVDQTDLAESVSAIIFGETELSDISDAEKQMLVSEAPHTDVAADETLVDVLIKAGLATSKREAREFIENKAVSVSGVVITDVAYTFGERDFINGLALLKRGKRNVSVLVYKESI